ncbi:DUF1304 family protein [Streptomyces enissocaesilis]|uniref:DUF998 domain-containing protein n=1 Tax=Streptomyces enissocaesilis TaxID=332589 RepID=A0ABN3WTP8_9ACTN
MPAGPRPKGERQSAGSRAGGPRWGTAGTDGASRVFALLAAAVHIAGWPTESFLHGRPRVRALCTGSTADAPGVRAWRFGVGFHNPFLALGPIAGIVALHLGHETAGRSSAIRIRAFLIVGGIMLFASGPELWRGSLGQAPPPAVAPAAGLL